MTAINKCCKRHRMQIGYILGFLIFPVFLDGCCTDENRKQTKTEMLLSRGLRGKISQQHYRAVEGEMFMVMCIDGEVLCSRTGEGNKHISFNCGTVFPAEAKHSGNYTCSGSKLFFYLQVLERASVGCFQPNKSSLYLHWNVGGMIPCPGLSCSNNTNVSWYTQNQAVSEQHRRACRKTGQLQLCEVNERSSGYYFCDKQISERDVRWTFRTAVNVTAIPPLEGDAPTILSPDGPQEVELGKPYSLVCKVNFPFEASNFSPKVQWFKNYSGKMEEITTKMQQLKRDWMSQVIQTAIITRVTREDLKYAYTCMASNTFGRRKVTIELKERIKVSQPSVVIYLFAPLLLGAGLVFVLRGKWLEIQLIYRSYFQYGKQNTDEKEFDVFLSYVWSPSSAEADRVLTLDLQKDPDDEAHLSSKDPLKASRRPLEEQLPEVLEGRWGYHLCLLERDMLPGGVYTDDVALAIQRSQMLICLLSDDFLSNNNAVFVLESGVKALLQNSILKLLLIWTDGASASLTQLDPPLPTLVQRALKVLPSLDWPSGKPATAGRKFWRSLKKAVPNHKVKLVSQEQEQQEMFFA